MGSRSGISRLQRVQVKDVVPNPIQPRRIFNERALSELAASIERNGLIQPIVVVETGDDGFTIVAGERRFRAMKMLGFETASVIVIEDGVTDELALIENVQREDLHPLEEAEAMQRLMERHGYTQEELAAVIGKARPTVTNTLKLNYLPRRVKEECSTSNIVSKSLLIEIAQLPEGERLRFWDEVKDGRTTVRKVRRKREGESRKQRPTTIPSAVRAGTTFRDRLKSVVESRQLNTRQLETLRQIHREVGDLLNSLESPVGEAREEPQASHTG